MIRTIFKRFLPQAPTAKVLRLTDIPASIYAVGDLHGCLDLLKEIEREIVKDSGAQPGNKLIVYLGDVIDRGPDTAGVIAHLNGAAPDGFQRVVLMGNHEAMMLQFLEAPQKHHRWLGYGGAETLMSYGIHPESEAGFGRDGSVLQHKLAAAIPDDHRAFLRDLPCGLEAGPYRFAHAGYELGRPAETQSRERLLWGPPEQSDRYRGTERLVHGHVPTTEVIHHPSRISIDLGAYKTGRLAALRIRPDGSAPKTIVVTRTPTHSRNTTEVQDLPE